MLVKSVIGPNNRYKQAHRKRAYRYDNGCKDAYLSFWWSSDLGISGIAAVKGTCPQGFHAADFLALGFHIR
jgi:hypothetical protein